MLNDCNLDICVIDGNELAGLGGPALGTGAAGLHGENVLHAVRSLQDLGLKVIIVTRGQPCKDVVEGVLRGSGTDTARLHCVSGLHNDGLDIVRIAEEYSCLFASNANFAQDEISWTLAFRQRAWVQKYSIALQVHYTCSAKQGFQAVFSSAVQAVLPSAVEGQRKQQSAAVLPSAVEVQRKQQSAIQAVLPSAVEGQRKQQSAVQAVLPSAIEGQSKQQSAECPESCLSVPPDTKNAELQEVEDADIDCADGLAACLIVVPRGLRSEYLLCVYCDDSGFGLLQQASSLAAEMLSTNADGLDERDGSDPDLRAVLASRGGCWTKAHFMVLTASSGRHAGCRAVGAGSNLKKRRRAAHLALAATSLLHASGKAGIAQNESEAMAALKEAVSDAIRTLQKRLGKNSGAGAP